MTSHTHEHLHPTVHADGTACTCESPVEGSLTAVDPVCEMSVTKEGAKHVASHQGQIYYFCSAGCRSRFLANPENYALAKGPHNPDHDLGRVDHAPRGHAHDGDKHSHAGHDHRTSGFVTSAASVKDPVCGMKVDPATAKHKADYERQTYYFCSEHCRAKFIASPESFVHAEAAKPALAPVPDGTIYTCPMHPQIRQVGPGNCPICGMSLEPEMPTTSTGPSVELTDMTRRFWVATALAIPVLAISMGGDLIGLEKWIPGPILNWVQLILATPAVLWAGLPFFERGLASLRNRALNMFTLIAMGIGVAWLFSIVATAAPGLFPASLRTMGGAVPVYFEAAAIITALALLGQVLELRARDQTSGTRRSFRSTPATCRCRRRPQDRPTRPRRRHR